MKSSQIVLIYVKGGSKLFEFRKIDLEIWKRYKKSYKFTIIIENLYGKFIIKMWWIRIIDYKSIIKISSI